MKKLNPFLLLVVLFITGQFLVSCGKDGELGPKGKDGTDGIAGKTGADGATILSGSENPSSATGKNGDFYLNLLSSELFGPKKDDQWSSSVSLNGKDGVDGMDGTNGNNGTNGSNGKDGNTILNRHGVPSGSEGKIGDFYLNLTTMDFYGPKTTTWGTPVSLKPASSLSKRILLKQDLGFELCENCYNYSTDWHPGHSTFSVTTPYVRLNVGDISEYLENGQIIYEVRAGGGDWITVDQTSNKPKEYIHREGDREYAIMYMPLLIDYYNNGTISFPTSTRITVPGVYSMQTLMNYVKAEAKIDVRITLLPNETVEIISKAYPNSKVDNKFISKYLSLQN